MSVSNLVSRASNGSGASATTLPRHIVFLIISEDATATIEFSFDDSTWYTLHQTVDTTEHVSISEWYPYLRGTVSAYGSGTVSIDMALDPN